MAFNQNYNQYQNPYPNQYQYQNQNAYQGYPYMSPQQRLQALEQQYVQNAQGVNPYQQQVQPQQMQQVQQAQQAPQQPQSQIMAVVNEQQARDYPADLTGALQIFATQDDSFIYAKKFNIATALIEFETYEKKQNNSSTATPSTSMPDASILLDIVGDFSSKLETMHSEIQALRKDVQNGTKLDGNSKADSEPESTDEINNGTNTGNGRRRAKSASDN